MSRAILTQHTRALPTAGWGPVFAAVVVAGALSVAVAAPPIVLAAAIVIGVLTVIWGTVNPRILLLALIFAVPFARWTKVEFGGFSVSAADFLLALVAAFWLARSLVDRRLTLHFGPALVGALVLLGASLLSALFAEHFPTALGELVKLAEMITIGLFAAAAFRDERVSAFALQALVFAAGCESLVALAQTITSSGPGNFAVGDFVRAYGDFDQPNALGGYLAMALPFGVALSTRPWPTRPYLITATVLIALALAATLSRGAWLGTVIGFSVMAAVWSLRTRRWLLLTLVLVAVMGAAAAIGLAPRQISDRLTVLGENFVVFDARYVQVNPTNFSLVERMAHWQAAWAMALDHPLVGVGPGNYEEAYIRYFLPGWPLALGHAHNIYLNTLAELGVIGLLAFLGFLVMVFARLAQALRAKAGRHDYERAALLAALAALTAFCVHNLFDNMFVHAIGIQVGLLIGLAEAIAGRITSERVAIADRN